jgi:hypothetical protein
VKGGIMGEKWPIKFYDFHRNRKGYFTYRKAPKEGVLRIFVPEKSDGFSRV